jgi:hypothetical protein
MAGWSVGRVVAPALTVLLLTGCVGPTVTDAGYRNKVADTAREISSSIASARLAVRLDLDGRMAFALTDQTVSDAESDADSAATALASRQPPTDSALRLYQRASRPIQDAVDALRTLRLAVRRGDPTAMRAALSGLDAPGHGMDDLRTAATAG